MLLMFLKLHITNLKMRTHKLKIKQIQTKSGFWRVMFRYIPYTTSQQQDASEKIRFNETLQRTCEKWVVARGGKWNSVKYMALENLFIEANKTAYNKWVKPVKMSPIKHANSAPGSKVKFVLPRNITDVQIARKMEDIKNLQLERKQAFSDVPVINVPPPPPPPIPAAPQEDAGPSSFRPTPLDASQKTILDAFVLNLTELMMLGQIDADQVARIRSALPPSAASEPIPPTSLEPIVVDDIVTDEAWDSFHALLSMLEQQMVIGKNVKMHIDIEATRKIHQT